MLMNNILHVDAGCVCHIVIDDDKDQTKTKPNQILNPFAVVKSASENRKLD